MPEYAVGAKRDVPSEIPAGWVSSVAATDGVDVVSETDGLLLVTATDDGIARLRSALGETLHIEPLVGFDVLTRPSAGTSA